MGEYVYNMGAQVVNGDDSLVAPLANELGVTRSLINKTKLPIIMKSKLVAASNEPSFLWQLPISLHRQDQARGGRCSTSGASTAKCERTSQTLTTPISSTSTP